MKKSAILLLVLSSILFAQKFPVAGKQFLLEYRPVASLKSSTDLKVVYAFDYWSIAGQPEQGHSALFSNVQFPDSGRKNEAVMYSKAGKWYAQINIPAEAKLLSYYITDGKTTDYNDEKTYIKYICDEKGKPVMGARFRNIDFMLMAGKTNTDIIKEIEGEYKDYPNSFLAYYVYWKYKLETAKDYADLGLMKNQIDKQFAALKSKPMKDEDLIELLGAELRVNDDFMAKLSKSFSQDRNKINDKIIQLCGIIPEEKRSAYVNRVFKAHKQVMDSQNFNEGIVGKKAPDFEFIDLKGEKVRLSDLKDKYILLDFWGTWCGPCVSEIPNLVKAYNMYKDKGFHIISISSDGIMRQKSKQDLDSFTAQREMNWTHCYDTNEIHKLYKISHWPTLFLVDKNGVVIQNENYLRGEMLQKTLEGLLGK